MPFQKNDQSQNSQSAIKNRSQRLLLLLLFFVALFAFLLYHLWKLQIVNGEKYAEDFELKITRTIREPNTRGNIYDCNGEVLAYNEPVYTAAIADNGIYDSNRERQLTLNSTIYHLLQKLTENQETIDYGLSIEIGADGNYEYTVTGQALERFLADLFGKADPADLTQAQQNTSAADLVAYLAGNQKFALYGEGKKSYTQEELQQYGLPDSYTKEEALIILGVRYRLSLHTYQKYVPVVLARKISDKTIAYLLENNQSLVGVSVEQNWERVYTGGEAFSHILGYTGEISTKELEAYADSDRGYTVGSIVGKAGLEQYLEPQLQGIDGEREIIVNNVGTLVGEGEVLQETVSGRDVYLSIDKNLQIAIYHMLEQNLAGILASNLINEKEFDKSKVSDTSQIRIPIYNVYQALFENEVIQLESIHSMDAAGQEQALANLLEEKRSQVLNQCKEECFTGNTEVSQLSQELQEYLFYFVDKTGILNENSMNKEDAMYQKWKKKSGITIKEFLFYAIEKGWLKTEILESKQSYLTAAETYLLVIEYFEKKIAYSVEFEKKLLQGLILEDRLTGRDICFLLYEQQVLSKDDGDYEALVSGNLSAFAFLKKKIEQLELTPAQLALDPCSASAAVVQPSTGKLLALVSYPGYDNSRLANQMDSKYYRTLLNDRSLPLYNRATQQLTAPGSTFKPVTIIAGLQEGVIFSDTQINCDGVFDKVEPNLKCWNHSGHGTVGNAPTALQFSCNDYLCEIAYRLGTKDSTEYTDRAALKSLQYYSDMFALNQTSGIEIAESKPQVTNAYGIPSAIGQGTHNYATVQLVRYVNALASEGDLFSLSLVKEVEDSNGNFVENPVQKTRVELPAWVWNTVRDGMVQFAEHNAVLKDMEIPIAGKTGTAQESKTRPDHALFVGYAPVEQPQITIAVRIANGYGSSNATSVGKRIFQYYFGQESLDEIVNGKASQAWNIRTD